MLRRVTSASLLNKPTHRPGQKVTNRPILPHKAATLAAPVAAWQASRKNAHVKANWRFTTKDARVKLHRLYPAV